MNLYYRYRYADKDINGNLVKGAAVSQRDRLPKVAMDNPVGVETIVPASRGDRPAVIVFFEPIK